MNKIVNTLLLAGDKFMPEMHSKQHGVTYCACGSFTKNKKSIKKFIQTGNTDFIYRNDLDKACFQHDMAYHKSKDLAKRNKVLRNKSFQIISDPKCHRYQIGLAAMVYQYFDKKNLVELVLLLNLCQIINLQMNFLSKLLESSKQEN